MEIRNLKLKKTACLAPMAGVADRAFREICVKFGACYTVGEMASSKGLMYSDKKTAELLEVYDAERPMAIQLFGDDPKIMAMAAKTAMEYHPDAIDINMGCPAPKIANNGSGSALMKNPKLAGEIVSAVRNATNLPLTVKFRKGWDENSVNAVEFAKIMEENGADAIAVHGRTRTQMYMPPVDIDIIKKVKESVNIPVIGNGDIVDVETALNMYNETKCDLIMIGRGALGSPWLFKQIEEYLSTGKVLTNPSLKEKMEIMLEHISLAIKYKGEKIGIRESRKHCAWYLKGMRGAAEFRRQCGYINTYEDLKALVNEVMKVQNEE